MLATLFLYMNDSSALGGAFGSLLPSEGTDADVSVSLNLTDICDMTETSATCDLSGTEMSTSLTDACSASAGKVVLHKASICEDTSGVDGVDTGGMAITMENIPFCMAKTCASGVGFMDILRGGLDYIDAETDMISALFDDGCVMIALQNEDYTSAASGTSSSVLATVLALGIAFFAF